MKLNRLSLMPSMPGTLTLTVPTFTRMRQKWELLSKRSLKMEPYLGKISSSPARFLIYFFYYWLNRFLITIIILTNSAGIPFTVCPRLKKLFIKL